MNSAFKGEGYGTPMDHQHKSERWIAETKK